MGHRRRWQVGLTAAGAVLAALLLVGQLWLTLRLQWTTREPLADSLLGLNFSCDQAEYLLLEEPGAGPDGFADDGRPGRAEWCAGVLRQLMEETGIRLVRLSVRWDEVEPEEGRFDFTVIEAELDAVRAMGGGANVSIGMKAQRHPEFYIPGWALEGVELREGLVLSEVPALRARALRMVGTVAAHLAGRPEIDSWTAENEGYIASHRAHRYSLSQEYVAEVARTIRAADPLGRPVVINHAQHYVFDRRWKDALADADVLAQSMYPRRNGSLLGRPVVIDIMQLGWLMPNYAHQARVARAQGKEFWVTELQAEPWTDGDARLISPERPSPNLSPATLRRNVEYARRTGALRIYLWGAEWWLYQRERYGDGSWLATVRELAAGAPQPGYLARQ
ncbi:beta-galactosidase [Tepidiforma sp.]|uniref:beta-galactosidase n=1 Tax=Tepidiforma sp. TaxID=2682230 RepID=UPI002ADD96EA|nr:beta-galactosidase [Tepidiforma sp.]